MKHHSKFSIKTVLLLSACFLLTWPPLCGTATDEVVVQSSRYKLDDFCIANR